MQGEPELLFAGLTDDERRRWLREGEDSPEHHVDDKLIMTNRQRWYFGRFVELAGVRPPRHLGGDRKSRHISRDMVAEVMRRDRGRCVLCGAEMDLQIDHKIPYSRGGLNHVDNLQVLCRPCNQSKSNKM